MAFHQLQVHLRLFNRTDNMIAVPMIRDDLQGYKRGRFVNDMWLNEHISTIPKQTKTSSHHNAMNQRQHIRDNFERITRLAGEFPPLQPSSVWLLPVNIANVHWVLIMLDMARAQIFQVDSLPPNDDVTENIRVIMSHLYGIKFGETFFPTLPIQASLSNDCGI